MTIKGRYALALAAVSGALLGACALLGLTLRSAMSAEARAALDRSLADSAGALIFLAMLLIAALGLALGAIFRRYVLEPQRLVEEAGLILSANRAHRIVSDGAPEARNLAAVINALAGRIEELEHDVDTRIAAAKRDVEQEKTRFAALMSELTDSVIVCNIAARILLYNNRAQRLLSPATDENGAAAHALVGLGRSLFTLIDRNAVSHALEDLQHRLDRGEREPISVFVTASPSGRTLRARMAPVLAHADAPEAHSEMTGFIVVLDDVTHELETDAARDRKLVQLIDRTRSGLGNIGAAVDALATHADMDAEKRKRFVDIIAAETQALGRDVAQASAEHRSVGPTLASIRGDDLIAALARAIEQRTGLAVTVPHEAAASWTRVDRVMLADAVVHLAGNLRAHNVGCIELSLVGYAGHVQLDLAWRGAPLAPELAREWQTMLLTAAGGIAPLSVDDVLRRHGGEGWYSRDESSGVARFRILLPLSDEKAVPIPAAQVPSRPTFYDFDLFQQKGQSAGLDQRPLAELIYTVFDTETTGLAPSQGDEIVSIGAVRIVNGRLLTEEVFDQLVNPRRRLPPISIRVHGITDEMVASAPPIGRALPAFHRFCEDTVLVAHNAAFDLRFLQLKQGECGVRFDHPVLDTLMLSAVVHPSQSDHTLEAIAARLGITVVGRHTALGDALLTGEIFLKLLPLLGANGIATLGQAREASSRTAYARVSY